ncbi:PAS domain S-box protein [Nostoc sp. FACHB-110]|uniref:sensor histidine kinase n=1 Tax=Nostoc sp. FACHB-110 TaxID=2692834 RepID=UPI001F558CE4|nr:PAS domain S-box protein [Nostoc sp. FACHB-110]
MFATYTVAVLVVSIAVLLTLLLQPLLQPTIFLLFFAAVVISAWYGGIKPGLLATGLSVLTVKFFFLEIKYSLLIVDKDSLVRLSLFVLVATLMSILSSELRDAKQRLEVSLQKLNATEAKFRSLVDANIIGVIFADITGEIIDANDAFLTIVGYTREDLVAGRVRWRDMTPPEYLAICERAISQLQIQGKVMPYEKEYIRKDGNRVTVLLGCAALADNQEQIIGFVLDLSASKQAQKALQKSEARLRTLTEKVRVIPWEADATTGDFTYIGPQTTDILGYSLSDWYKPNFWTAHIHPEDREWATKYCIESSLIKDNYEFEYRMLAADGRVIWLYDIVNVVRIAGKPKLLYGFMFDISDRKQAEQEREQLLEREKAARTEAEIASRLKDEFLATLSHELRTPLSAIIGWAQLLRNRKFNENTISKGLETISRNAKALAEIIEDILDVSCIIQGTLHLNTQPVQLIPIVEAAIESVHYAANAKEIQINYTVTADAELVVGDAKRLQQIIWNLLSNAVKFNSHQGRVIVQIERIDETIQIKVSDTGVGIAPEFLPYVFDRFRQADSSTTRSHNGLGLGLAIVRHLVELHGGTVTAESPGKGQGAIFTVNLPMKAATE